MCIAVTGKGIVSAIGIDEHEVWQSIMDAKSGVAVPEYLRTSHKELLCGEVKRSNDFFKEKLHIAKDKILSRTALFMIYAIRDAIRQAGIDDEELHRRRVVLVVGTTVGGMDLTENVWATLDSEPDNVKILLHHQTGDCTESVAEYFGFVDESMTIATACSSAANAIITGAELLKANKADIVIAGGGEALTRFHLNGFNSLMILDKEQCRPFDGKRAGLNLGEGAAFVVLENVNNGTKRAAKVQAYLTGYANRCDAYHQTASSPDGEGAYLAMTDAMKSAGLSPSQIDYINAHGTGTPNNDLSESNALRRAFPDAIPPVSSTKPFTGHTTSASGAIEAVICIMALDNGYVPQNLGFKSADDGCITPVASGFRTSLKNVMCSSFGFGGNDSTLIFSSAPTTGEVRHYDLHSQITVAGHHKFTDNGEIDEIKQYLKPAEYRRMNQILRVSLLTSLKALKNAGIEKPDAIITATSLGCWEYTEYLLDQLATEGETTQKPSYFMQSTHNTIGSNIAAYLKCHGYNTTFSHGEKSMDLAMKDAENLLVTGQCKNVLVGCHYETSPRLRELMHRLGVDNLQPLYSEAFIMSIERT